LEFLEVALAGWVITSLGAGIVVPVILI